jgi:hypothetical protein
MQIFGAAPERGRTTTLMLHVYDGNLAFYHDLQRVLAENIYDRWIRLNVIHDVAASNITVYIDGDERLSYRGPGAPGALITSSLGCTSSRTTNRRFSWSRGGGTLPSSRSHDGSPDDRAVRKTRDIRADCDQIFFQTEIRSI